MAEIISLDAARQARRDRAGARDLAVLAACCCWPVTLAWFMGLAAVEASIGVIAAAGGSRS